MRTWDTTRTRHGTQSGWRLHQSLGERPCDPCYRAKQEYDARRKASSRQQVKARLAAKAQNRAYMALAHRYPDEYRDLYDQFKREIATEYGIEATA